MPKPIDTVFSNRFNACETAGIEQVNMKEDHVRIRGFYPGSFPTGFLGHHAEQVDNTLYVTADARIYVNGIEPDEPTVPVVYEPILKQTEGMCLGMCVGTALGDNGLIYGMLLGLVVGMLIKKEWISANREAKNNEKGCR